MGFPWQQAQHKSPLTPRSPHSLLPSGAGENSGTRGRCYQGEKRWGYKQVQALWEVVTCQDYRSDGSYLCPRNHTSESKARTAEHPPHPVLRHLHHLIDSVEILQVI